MKVSKGFLQSTSYLSCDSSGYERSYASRYYTKIAKSKISSIKTMILVDADKRIVFDIHMTATSEHDIKIGARLLKKRNIKKLSVLIADKGYDGERIRGKLRGIKQLIRRSEYNFHDRIENDCMDKRLYGKKDMVKSVNFAVKRRKVDRKG